jgi:hypothetical protein
MADPDENDDDVFEQLDDSDTLDDPRTSPADPLDEGVSPNEQPWGTDAWGTTPREEETGQPLAGRLRREDPDTWAPDEDGDGIGDTSDTDGEPWDDEVGERRTGRLVLGDDGDDGFAVDTGLDGAGASAEEAAIHDIGRP